MKSQFLISVILLIFLGVGCNQPIATQPSISVFEKNKNVVNI